MAIFKKFLGVEEYLKMSDEEKKQEYINLSLQFRRVSEMESADPDVNAAKNAYEQLREPYKNRKKSIKQRLDVLLGICDLTLVQEAENELEI